MAKELFPFKGFPIDLIEVNRRNQVPIPVLTDQVIRTYGIFEAMQKYTNMDFRIFFEVVSKLSRQDLLNLINNLDSDMWKVLLQLGDPSKAITIISWIRNTYPSIFIELVVKYPELMSNL